MLTGSDASGHLAYFAGRPATCGDWTRDGEGVAIIGHDDRMDASSHDNPRFVHWSGSWNAEHETTGCSAAHLAETGGGGAFYCFAADPGPASASPPVDAASYWFRRGVNLNHWLADNLAPEQLPNAHYGADWFAEDDVAWIAARGFDHLRIWVDGAAWLDAEGHLDEAAIARFDDALRWSAAHGLGVVLAMYGLPGHRAGIRGAPQPDAASPFTDAATRGDAAYLWWAIAHRYRDVGDRLRFELLVRPEAEDAAHRKVERITGKRVVVAALLPPGVDAEIEFAALTEEVARAGGLVVGRVVQRRGVSRSPRAGGAAAARAAMPMSSKTYLGAGKADELRRTCATTGADLVVFYNTLNEGRRTVLAEIIGVAVLNRSDLTTETGASNG